MIKLMEMFLFSGHPGHAVRQPGEGERNGADNGAAKSARRAAGGDGAAQLELPAVPERAGAGRWESRAAVVGNTPTGREKGARVGSKMFAETWTFGKASRCLKRKLISGDNVEFCADDRKT